MAKQPTEHSTLTPNDKYPINLPRSVNNPYQHPGQNPGEEPSRTIQDQKDDVNINNIVARYVGTGVLAGAAGRGVARQPFQGDFSNQLDYQTKLNKLIEAKSNFEKLPSKIRTRFENDPGQLIQFMSNPDNAAEALTLGLTAKPPVKEVPTVKIHKDPETPPKEAKK